jgi:hypothetical protein
MRKPPAAALIIMLGSATTAVIFLAGCGSVVAPDSSPAQSPAAQSGAAASQTAGSQPAASPSPPASSQPAEGQPAASDCPASAIKVSLDTGAAGVAAGSSYVPLEIRNASARSCTLPGYPQVSFASGLTGPAIGGPAALEQQSTARPLVLTPGQLAHAWLQIGDAANYPAGSCKPVTAQGLRIVFGSATPGSFISRDITVCGAAVHGTTLLAVYPVTAGHAKRGSAP